MGYNVDDIYRGESKYLAAPDLKNQEHRLRISEVRMAELQDNGRTVRKLELMFAGAQKGLLLNKTNATTISHAYTPDTDQWLGKELFVYPTMVDFQGRQVEAIRVRPALPAAASVPPFPQQPPPAPVDEPPYADPVAADDLDMDIPFSPWS